MMEKIGNGVENWRRFRHVENCVILPLERWKNVYFQLNIPRKSISKIHLQSFQCRVLRKTLLFQSTKARFRCIANMYSKQRREKSAWQVEQRKWVFKLYYIVFDVARNKFARQYALQLLMSQTGTLMLDEDLRLKENPRQARYHSN